MGGFEMTNRRRTDEKNCQDWGSGTRRCRGRPTAPAFSLRRQRKVSKEKATRSLGPCASLRVPCGAQTQWGHVQTRLRLKQARALIHWLLRSSAQPGRGLCLSRYGAGLNGNFKPHRPESTGFAQGRDLCGQNTRRDAVRAGRVSLVKSKPVPPIPATLIKNIDERDWSSERVIFINRI